MKSALGVVCDWGVFLSLLVVVNLMTGCVLPTISTIDSEIKRAAIHCDLYGYTLSHPDDFRSEEVFQGLTYDPTLAGLWCSQRGFTKTTVWRSLVGEKNNFTYCACLETACWDTCVPRGQSCQGSVAVYSNNGEMLRHNDYLDDTQITASDFSNCVLERKKQASDDTWCFNYHIFTSIPESLPVDFKWSSHASCMEYLQTATTVDEYDTRTREVLDYFEAYRSWERTRNECTKYLKEYEEMCGGTTDRGVQEICLRVDGTAEVSDFIGEEFYEESVQRAVNITSKCDYLSYIYAEVELFKKEQAFQKLFKKYKEKFLKRLTRTLKDSVHDPSSLRDVKCVVGDLDYDARILYCVTCSYRAKNGYGALRIEEDRICHDIDTWTYFLKSL